MTIHRSLLAALFAAPALMLAAPADASWLSALLRQVFVAPGSTRDATWAVFFVPAAILLGWAALDAWLIKETPEDAGFPYLDTHDASSGKMHIELTTLDLLKKVFASPLMLLIAAIGLTSGAYSSIGVAAPLFAMWKEREPKFAALAKKYANA